MYAHSRVGVIGVANIGRGFFRRLVLLTFIDNGVHKMQHGYLSFRRIVFLSPLCQRSLVGLEDEGIRLFYIEYVCCSLPLRWLPLTHSQVYAHRYPLGSVAISIEV